MSDLPSDFSINVQPASPATANSRPQYPYNNATQTDSGHSFEMDDTPGQERVRIQHNSGTYIEMSNSPNGNKGDLTSKIWGNNYTVVVKDNVLQVQGKLKIEVAGDAEIHVAGDLIETIDGNVERHVKGNFSQVVEGITNITSAGNMVLNAGGSATGSIFINTGNSLYLDCDLYVKGLVSSTIIHSDTRVDAGTGMSAGYDGFVTVTGGVSAGVAKAAPGIVLASAEVIAPLVVGSTMVYGNSLMDPSGGTPLIRSIYDKHTHTGYRGDTTPPLQLLPLP